MKLLTTDNTKTTRGEKRDYLTGILYLAPASLSGRNVCPASTPGCRAACLYTAGRGAMHYTQQARLRKTEYLFTDRAGFMVDLVADTEALQWAARRRGMVPCVRLNGTSDLPWERMPVGDATNIMELFPSLQFYDYTKARNRTPLSNYHLTYSLSEIPGAIPEWVHNIAVAWAGKAPADYNGFNTIDGDTDDLRFLDPPGSAALLKPKGKARKDSSGFVHRLAVLDAH